MSRDTLVDPVTPDERPSATEGSDAPPDEEPSTRAPSSDAPGEQASSRGTSSGADSSNGGSAVAEPETPTPKVAASLRSGATDAKAPPRRVAASLKSQRERGVASPAPPVTSPSGAEARPVTAPSGRGTSRSWAGAATALLLVLGLSILVGSANRSASARLVDNTSAPEAETGVAIAAQAEVAYCTPEFKQVLERVLHSCGLDAATSRRGCQPSDIKSLASITDDDFNALFTPLEERGAVLLFDNAEDELDGAAQALLDERFADRRGARYFFVVARASKRGSLNANRALSHRRANSVKFHLEETTQDPELDRQVGQLWLGSEYAQLDKSFCEWPNSRADGKCTEEAINRSVFVSWVDCRL